MMNSSSNTMTDSRCNLCKRVRGFDADCPRCILKNRWVQNVNNMRLGACGGGLCAVPNCTARGDDLEEDTDNPGTFYCGQCWEDWDWDQSFSNECDPEVASLTITTAPDLVNPTHGTLGAQGHKCVRFGETTASTSNKNPTASLNPATDAEVKLEFAVFEDPTPPDNRAKSAKGATHLNGQREEETVRKELTTELRDMSSIITDGKRDRQFGSVLSPHIYSPHRPYSYSMKQQKHAWRSSPRSPPHDENRLNDSNDDKPLEWMYSMGADADVTKDGGTSKPGFSSGSGFVHPKASTFAKHSKPPPGFSRHGHVHSTQQQEW